MTDAGRGQVVDFEEEVRKVQDALVSFTSGQRENVAVIGDPFSGKTSLLREVADRYGGTVDIVRLSRTAGNIGEVLPETGRDGILAVDDCQFLYKRKIGGFGALEKFLDRTAASKDLFITTWNRFSWDYLKQAYSMADYFPIAVEIPTFDASKIEAVVRSRYDLEHIRLAGGEKERTALPQVKWMSLKLGGFGLNVPAVKPGRKLVDNALDIGRPVTMESVFQRLADLSYGNPGVALAIWNRALWNGSLYVDEVKVPDYDVDLDFDEAFVLSTILMTKRATGEDILEVAAERLQLDKILYILLNRKLIRVDDGAYCIEPLAFHSIVKSLKKSRLVT